MGASDLLRAGSANSWIEGLCLARTERGTRYANFQGIAGERGGNRTYNLVIKSHLLCQLSYAPVQGETFNIVAPERRAILQWSRMKRVR